jgi:hypothetical protein
MAVEASQTRTLRVGSQQGKLSTLAFDATTFTVTRDGAKVNAVQVPVRQVLWVACAEDNVIEVHLLARKKKSASSGLTLVNVNGKLDAGVDKATATQWVEGLMDAAYQGPFLSPFSFARV